MHTETLIYIGRCTNYGRPFVFAVQAATHDELVEWLTSDLCINDHDLSSLHVDAHTTKTEALACLQRAFGSVDVTGNFPEALALEEKQREASWDEFLDELATGKDPQALADWVRLQRSMRDPRETMWVVNCSLLDGRRVTSVQIERTRGIAVASASDAIQRWIGSDCFVKSFTAVSVGKLDSPNTDRRAMELLRQARADGHELLGALQVIGAHELNHSPANS